MRTLQGLVLATARLVLRVLALAAAVAEARGIFPV
jgi:hypothetical protein